jgi:hypothetical protein
MSSHFTLGLRSLRVAGLAIALLAAMCTPLLAQAPPSADTFVSSSTAKTNYGSAIALVVGQGTTSYVQFNVAGIPAGATISKATLRLYVDAVAKAGKFDVYQLNSSWAENTLTYNTPPPPLGLSVTSGPGVSITAASLNQFLLIDITALARGWVNGTIPNNGVALALTTGSSGSFSFDSKESLLTGNGPELEIAFTSGTGPQGPPGATGAQGLQGLTGATGATGSIGPMGLVGPQGPAGTNGINGTNGTGFDFRNAFDPTVIYASNDVVSYNGATYVAIAANGPSSSTPDVNSAWTIMAQQGATGAAGATGPAGANGTQGPQGSTGATGATGPQGAIGLTGATGPQGLQGFSGPTGPQGPQGATGPPGLAGTDPNSRMIFPIFFPGNLSGTWIGGQFVLDQAITVLRIAATAKTPTGTSCPAAVFRFTDGTKGQDLVLTPGQSWSDTGSIQLTFAAGATLQASLRTGSTCGANAAGADANLLVEYKVQAAGDSDTCPSPNKSCGTFCTNTALDPANCGSCGTTCTGGVACANGNCAGQTISCNTAADCPAEPNTTSPTCISNKCGYAACTVGFNDCDQNITNGCECVGGCLGSACAPLHSNGVGQTYTDAFALGTYTSVTATEAATAYETSVGSTGTSVSDGWQCGGTGPTFVCATDPTQNPVYCWGYSGSIAGRVSNGSCPFGVGISTWK